MAQERPDELSAERFQQIITTSRVLAAGAFESFGDLPLTGCFLVGAAVDPLASNAGDMVLACGSVITERMHDGRVTEVVRDRVL